MVHPESKICKLTMDHNNKVWSVMGDTVPRCSNLGIKEYLSTLIKSRRFFGLVRVLGSHLNAKLISELYGLVDSGEISSLGIGRPDRAYGLSPDGSLLKMRTLDLAACMGGWHIATPQDRIGYGVASMLQDDPNSVEAVALMKQHPLWGYATFVLGIDETAFAHVFSYILDPRWFVDAARPYRLSKLYSWLGLMNGPQSDLKIKRKEKVYACWQQGAALSGTDGGKVKWGVEGEINKMLGGNKEWQKTLRGSQLFVRYIRLAWLDCIYSYPNPWMERILDPDLFFKSSDSSLRFKCHNHKSPDS